MTQPGMSLDHAFDEVSASSAGGAPFLVAYGATFVLTGGLSFVLPAETVALIAMFQGGVALPFAFWLERRLGWGRMAAGNPLRSLSLLLAISQALALPILILAYNLNPRSIPMILAGLGGVHFLPYAWLHRTQLYVALSTAVSLGAFGLLLALGPTSFHAILLFVGVLYWLAAPLVYRRASQLTAPGAPPALAPRAKS